MKGTLLIVGAGYGQLPAIQKAKSLGLKVITVDKNPNAVGVHVADIFYEIDVLNKEAILDIAIKHRIDGIMTLQSDFGLPAVGYVNSKLGLQGTSIDTATVCSDKKKIRIKLQEKKCSQPEFIFVRNLSEAIEAAKMLSLPCVIKTPDSSASRGITKVCDIRSIMPALKEAFKFTSQDKVIVEKYIDGLEFGAQTFCEDGDCKIVLMHSDTLSKSPGMIPIGHSFPFTEFDEKKEIKVKNLIKTAVICLGIQDGPANVDLIWDKKSDEVNILEISPRIGATCLPELIKYHTGINWIEQAIKSALGIKPDLNIRKKVPVAAMILQSPKDGIYKGYSFKSKQQKQGIIEYAINVDCGEKIKKLRNGTDRIGNVVTTGKTAKCAEKNSKDFLDSIIIKVA